MSLNPNIGEIRMFGGNFAPRGWAFCDGQLLAIAQNSALFSILGTTYGGDGRTSFGLPSLRGRIAMHAGNGPGLTPRPLGQKSGQENVTLNNLQIPSHNHLLTGSVNVGVNEEAAISNEGSGAVLGQGSNIFNSNPPESGENLGGVSHNLQVGNDGGSQSHNNMPPYQAINYIIALVGKYPSRS